MAKEFDTKLVLELACAAQRTYNAYVKEPESVYDKEGKFLYVKHTNKDLIKHALGITKGHYSTGFEPMNLILTPEDSEQAEAIRQYFKRLMFSAVAGTSEFETEVNSLLSGETIPDKKIGYIACLPSVYAREQDKKVIKKGLSSCDNEGVGVEGQTLSDKDCEIVNVKRSKNFDAWNVLAIIDNKIVSWFNKFEPKIGPAVVRKAKVKGFGENWQTKKVETRLNYVKIAQ